VLGGRLLWTAGEVARKEGVAESGYRVIINTGPDSGQIIPHLHLHVLGGRPMHYPIG
jgi:histidine triad (HIT) family protein